MLVLSSGLTGIVFSRSLGVLCNHKSIAGQLLVGRRYMEQSKAPPFAARGTSTEKPVNPQTCEHVQPKISKAFG